MNWKASESPSRYCLAQYTDTRLLQPTDGLIVNVYSACRAPQASQLTAKEGAHAEESVPLPAPSSFKARFFGHFELFCDGQIVTLGRSSKTLSILKYLAGSGRRTHLRLSPL